jgi:hypothetical protein
MRKVLLCIAAATTAGAMLTSPAAQARCKGCRLVGGGLTIAPIMFANYYVASPGSCRSGYWERRPIRDPWGNLLAWGPPRFVCRSL